MINIWRSEFEFNNEQQTGDTHYVLDDRPMIDEVSLLKTNDVHFKFQKCLNGVTYSYIKDTNDIYDKSILTGDGHSINNMYNEYNIIDKYLENLHRVDIAFGGEDYPDFDFSLPYFELDDIKLKPGHLILIFGQNDKTLNNIYIVNYKYYLEKTDLLETREDSNMAKFYVKIGTYSEYQFFLENESIIFPISDEEKTFTPYHSYMLKSKLNYDINNTDDTAGMIFTNLDVARHLQDNSSTYSSISFDFPNTTIIFSIDVISGETFTLNLLPGYVYKARISWGDGNISDVDIEPLVATNITNTYSDSGRYTIVISGIFESLDFENNQNIHEIVSWGMPNNTQLSYISFENSSLEIIPNESGRLKYVDNFENTFKSTNISNIPIGLFAENTTATSFEATFENCSNITEISTIFEDNINIETFEITFKDCNQLETIPPNLFENNILVTTFEFTFENCNLSVIPDILFENNILVTSFENTFKDNSLTILDSSYLFMYNTLVTSFKSTFENNLIVNVSEIFENNTLVTTFDSTFKNNKLTTFSNSLFENNTLVTTFESTFESNELIVVVDIFENNTLVTTFKSTFKNNLIVDADSELFQMNELVTTFESTFENNRISELGEEHFWNCPLVTTFKSTFKDNLITIYEDTLFSNQDNVLTYESTFENNLITYTFGNFFSSSVDATNFDSTFKNNKLGFISSTLFASNININSFKSTFENNNISTIHINLFSTNVSVTTFESTFKDNNFIQLPGNIFDQNISVVTFESCFENNKKLRKAHKELFEFNISVESFKATFKNCKKLRPYIGNFENIFDNNLNVTDFSECFYYCRIIPGDAPSLWTRLPYPEGHLCFYECDFDNQSSIPIYWKE